MRLEEKWTEFNAPRIRTSIISSLSLPMIDGHRLTRKLSCGDKWPKGFLDGFYAIESVYENIA